MTKRTPPRALLDVNVVLAIVDPAHEHHTTAWDWFQAEGRGRFATCPLVQNGVVRIASSAAYPNRPGDVDVVRQVLARLIGLPGHEFWPDSISIVTNLPERTGITSKNVTDVYLAALAAQHGGTLVTFDQSIPVAKLALHDSSVMVLRPIGS